MKTFTEQEVMEAFKYVLVNVQLYPQDSVRDIINEALAELDTANAFDDWDGNYSEWDK